MNVDRELCTQAGFLDRQTGLASLAQLCLVLCCGYPNSIMFHVYALLNLRLH